MLEIYVVRKQNHLVPSDAISAESVETLPENEVYRVKINRPRNYKHLQKYMVLMNLIFKNQSVYASELKMRKAIEMAAGHYDTMQTLAGETIIIPSSVDFASLPQREFERVYEAVCNVVAKELLHGIEDAVLKREVELLIGIN